jgi:hypothetical protein
VTQVKRQGIAARTVAAQLTCHMSVAGLAGVVLSEVLSAAATVSHLPVAIHAIRLPALHSVHAIPPWTPFSLSVLMHSNAMTGVAAAKQQ